MAGNGLIDEYLRALDRRTRGRADQQDLIDEIADHLLSAAERLEQRGVPREEAESRALARLGEPRLVAALLTSTPTKGTIVSLFFSRRLGVFAALAAFAWAAAGVASYFGFTSLSGSWTPDRYLLSAVLVSLACALTAAVLFGVNIRAHGRIDRATITIAAISVFAAAAALVLAWVVSIWLPLLAIAVSWTCARARHAHAGSPAFATTLAILSPVVAVAAIALSAYGTVTGSSTEAAIWISVAALSVLLLAGFADIAARIAHSIRPAASTA